MLNTKYMAFSLFLLDNEKASIQAISIYKLDKEKKIKISKLDKVFFDLQVIAQWWRILNYLNQVIPLFGDMQMSPFQYVKSSVQFDPSKWPLSNSATLSPQVRFPLASRFPPADGPTSNSATILLVQYWRLIWYIGKNCQNIIGDGRKGCVIDIKIHSEVYNN